ncbi:MAG: universal stress protein [Solirubrobacteraceae bacterium]
MSAVARRDADDEPQTEAGPWRRILLASEGRSFSGPVISRTMELARQSGATVHVLSIARVHGVAFGLPNPGLLPTKREWDEQRESVRKAVARLRRKGIDADGHVVGTRNATKRIIAEARAESCEVIVMAADPDRARLIGDTIWSQEPQRVRRKSRLPVILVREDG